MKKYAKGGYEDMSSMTMEDVADMRARAKAEKAYNRAMPDPYEEGDSKEKRRAVLDNAINAPIDMAKKAVSKVKNFADSTEGKRLGMAAKLAVESSMPYQSMRPGLAAAEYGIDKLKEEGGRRKRDTGENTNPAGDTFKRGGKISSASRRADGIATKGKTRGKMC